MSEDLFYANICLADMNPEFTWRYQCPQNLYRILRCKSASTVVGPRGSFLRIMCTYKSIDVKMKGLNIPHIVGHNTQHEVGQPRTGTVSRTFHVYYHAIIKSRFRGPAEAQLAQSSRNCFKVRTHPCCCNIHFCWVITEPLWPGLRSKWRQLCMMEITIDTDCASANESTQQLLRGLGVTSRY